jgi:predicted ATPase
MVEIVGRDEELAFLAAFVAGAVEGPSTVVLDGEVGIGKSTLWRAGVEHARSQGRRILSSRPAEAERGLALVGLGDLFDDVLGDVLPELAPPRRRALEVALLLQESAGDRTDRRALGLAT